MSDESDEKRPPRPPRIPKVGHGRCMACLGSHAPDARCPAVVREDVELLGVILAVLTVVGLVWFFS